MKKYNIIYADPPWSYRDKALSGNRGAGCKYKVQSKEWLENLQITNIADKNCILFLWVTMPKLNEGFDLIKNWGFEYKTVAFTWIKKNKVTDSYFGGWAGGRGRMPNCAYFLQKASQNASAPGFTL